MSNHGTNPNNISFIADFSRTFYKTLATSSRAPTAPIIVLNPNDPSQSIHQQGYESGLLNANQNLPCLAGSKFYTIGTGYGSDPNVLYTTRKCDGFVPRQSYGHTPQLNTLRPIPQNIQPSQNACSYQQ